jgi:Kef-type K+ transport system membrane component KefB
MGDEWIVLLQTVAFMFAIWFAGDISKYLLLPPIISEIIVGVILGPEIFNIVPFVNHSETSVFVILGTIGVTLLIMHSGIHANIKKIKIIGKKASLIGIIGTLVPMTMGFAVFWLLGYRSFEQSFIACISITPASVSIAMRALMSLRKLNTSYGQAILTAANIDDFLAILLFIGLNNMTKDNITFVSAGLPILGAIIFVIIGIVLAVYVFPSFLNNMLFKITKKWKIHIRDKIHMVLLFVLLICYSVIGHYIGSHYIGAFLAGLTFSQVQRSIILWRLNIKPIMSWLLRFFFAATVAFKIPVTILFTSNAWWQGIIIAGVCIVSKLVSALHMGKNKWIIGWALVSRGEFSFLIAEFALEEQIIDQELFSVIVWGLIISTLIAPIVLQYNIKKQTNVNVIDDHRVSYQLILEGNHHDGILFEVFNTIANEGYFLTDAVINTDGINDKDVIMIRKNNNDNITDDDLVELTKVLDDAVADPYIKIMFKSIEKVREGTLDIDIIGNKISETKKKIEEILKEKGLTIISVEDNIFDESSMLHIKTMGRPIKECEEHDLHQHILKESIAIDPTVKIIIKLIKTKTNV